MDHNFERHVQHFDFDYGSQIILYVVHEMYVSHKKSLEKIICIFPSLFSSVTVVSIVNNNIKNFKQCYIPSSEHCLYA